VRPSEDASDAERHRTFETLTFAHRGNRFFLLFFSFFFVFRSMSHRSRLD